MKKNIFKKIITLTSLMFLLFGFLTPVHFSLAATCATPPTCTSPSVVSSDGCSCTYVLLAPLPNPDGGTTKPDFDPTGTGGGALGGYLNMMIKLFIGICAVLAVIMIVVGGIEYMTSELPGLKSEGKDRIVQAILGLLLALGAWTLLNTINPNLLDSSLSSLKDVTIDVTVVSPESPVAFSPIQQSSLQSAGIVCNNSGGASALTSTAQSFIGHSTYNQNLRNTMTGSTANVDCSSFVDQTYTCAGLPSPGNNTRAIFSSGATSVKSTDISVNGANVTVGGTLLKPGDLLGWTTGQGGESSGHVIMYVGNGQIIDAQGGSVGTVTQRPLSANMISKIAYYKPGPS